MECDTHEELHSHVSSSFNPRTPCGVRLDDPHHYSPGTIVSIHALLVECDLYTPGEMLEGEDVSIHALLVECD